MNVTEILTFSDVTKLYVAPRLQEYLEWCARTNRDYLLLVSVYFHGLRTVQVPYAYHCILTNIIGLLTL